MTSSKKIIFDLDGVLRDLHGYIEERFFTSNFYCNTKFLKWDGKIGDVGEGLSLPEAVERDNFLPLLYSKPTKYFSNEIVNLIDEIWTHQAEHWIFYTQKWIDKYITPIIGKYPIVRILNPNQKLELLESQNAILIEDNPTLPPLDNIILVERLYNKNSRHRKVHSQIELLELISKYK